VIPQWEQRSSGTRDGVSGAVSPGAVWPGEGAPPSEVRTATAETIAASASSPAPITVAVRKPAPNVAGSV
jgi:hypothetical protein